MNEPKKITFVGEVTKKIIPCPKFGCQGTLEPCAYDGREVLGCDNCKTIKELDYINEYEN